MDPLAFSPLLALALLFLLGTSLWVAVSLLTISVVGMVLFTNAPVTLTMPSTMWSALSSWTLTALPLFIWMGESCSALAFRRTCSRGSRPGWAGCRGGCCT